MLTLKWWTFHASITRVNILAFNRMHEPYYLYCSVTKINRHASLMYCFIVLWCVCLVPPAHTHTPVARYSNYQLIEKLVIACHEHERATLLTLWFFSISRFTIVFNFEDHFSSVERVSSQILMQQSLIVVSETFGELADVSKPGLRTCALGFCLTDLLKK